MFQTKALQHTNVELTWDKEDETRKRALSRKLTADELKEDDFKAYLATDSEDSSEEDRDVVRENETQNAEAIRNRYRKLLESNGVQVGEEERAGGKEWTSTAPEDEDRNMEMEVTFDAGLESLGERLTAKRKDAVTRAGETVWEAYIRRRREKKAEARRMGKFNADSDNEIDSGSSQDEDVSGASDGDANDPFFQHEGDPFADPFFRDGDAVEGKEKQKKKKQDRKGEKEEDGEASAKKKAELELLLMDESALLGKANKIGGKCATGVEGKRPILTNPGIEVALNKKKKGTKKERAQSKKDERRRERQAGSDDEDLYAGAGFQVDLEDVRFKNLYASADFALDPTDPRFAKAGPAAAKVAAEVAKRRSKMLVAKGAEVAPTGKERRRGGESGGAADLKMLVASLKRKAKGLGVDDDFKRSKKASLQE